MVKLVFGLALLFFILWKIGQEPVLDQLNELLLTKNGAWFIALVVFLMTLNWWLEILKWKILMKSTQELSWKQASLSVLAGISTGLVTPNRIGNFIGRSIYAKQEVKTKAVLLTFHANLAQFCATILFGIVGLLWLGIDRLELAPELYLPLVLGLAFVGLWIYFKPILLNFYPLNKLYSNAIKDGIKNVNESPFSLKLLVLFLSLLRYAVFLTQYVLLLLAFGADLSLLSLMASIALVFLFSTLFPSILFGKLFVREASALFVLSEMGVDATVILITAFLLWLINLALPALSGVGILMGKK